MRRTPVSSTNIQSIGYESNSRVLEIEFRQGAVYQYSNVPASLHRGLMNAASHGSYFHAHIRDRYATTRIR
ncbi:MAG: KTSC domain-containing protein [Acidimicrobiaceae bacterium]|nr:KTSC domain-containing protein [Acidimicrobiaceae bacterium]MXW76670.1 KTSC domain-containing protein [Acidimicrobiaceae bacterium]MYC43074.1 KTSC domain-containing protein [Acidimicrobiaceae bacterium]MYD08240.1 KTSC domain-containing protein [Acidimicrobiaceae bacterium]MYH87068.1 KTSC domain-containing protein [Acidimicrobiaceae bacterium]